jgi:hypothetical protein
MDIQLIGNSFKIQARDWLKKHGFAIITKSGASLLLTS